MSMRIASAGAWLACSVLPLCPFFVHVAFAQGAIDSALVSGAQGARGATQDQVARMPAVREYAASPERPLYDPISDGVWSQVVTGGQNAYHWCVYDPIADRMIASGGAFPPGVTWALSLGATPTWTQLTMSSVPVPVSAAVAIFDPVRNRVIQFSGDYTNEVWALSLAGTPSWTKLLPLGGPPAGRQYAVTIYDPVRDRMLVFAGWGPGALTDVWAMSLSDPPTWTLLTPGGTPPPSGLSQTGIYDPVNDRLVVYGGYAGGLWALAFSGGLQWIPIAVDPGYPEPPSHAHGVAIYDQSRRRMVLFGGYNNGARLNDTWAVGFDGTPRWIQLQPTGQPPAPTDVFSGIFQPSLARMIVFGGIQSSPGVFALTWPALPGPPLISGFSPAGGLIGDTVQITGQALANALQVTFNGVVAQVTQNTPTLIVTSVPAGAATGSITVVTAGGAASSSASFFVGQIPQITGVTPSGGPVGTVVTISGNHFSGATKVAFGSTSNATFIVVSDQQITATVDAAAVTGPMTVMTPAASGTSAITFYVTQMPTISGFSPAGGPVGTTVTIGGSHFTGTTAVTFGSGTPNALFTLVSDSEIHADVPVGAVSGPIFVTNYSGTASSSGDFAVAPPPPDNVISVSGGGCVGIAPPCGIAHFTISRLNAIPIRGFSVTFQISSNLRLCSGLSSITEGPYLAGGGTTTFQVTDRGSGLYTADGAILGTPCGATASTGELFSVSVLGAAPGGAANVQIVSLKLRDCDLHVLPVSPGGAAPFNVDLSPPSAVTDLHATQVKTGNDPASGVTGVRLTFTTPQGISASGVSVYRGAFRDYPEYGPPLYPITPPGYPPGLPWQQTSVTASGQVDQPPARGFYNYVIFTRDACGLVSPVSNMTSGTLDYFLGDVTNGTTQGQGDNRVNTADLSLLGSAYGATGSAVLAVNFLDVGPTSDGTVDGQPTPDDVLDFEDLIVFAANFGGVSSPAGPSLPGDGTNDALTLSAPTTVVAGENIAAELEFNGASKARGVSIQLSWDPSVVEPLSSATGPLLEGQGGIVLFPRIGSVDAVVLGQGERAIAGRGILATVTFRALATGDPMFKIEKIAARDSKNHPIFVQTDERHSSHPSITALFAPQPNPFRGDCMIGFSLAQSGSVDLAVYGVDGRLVRGLKSGVLEAGTSSISWDGRDDRGELVQQGVYYVRLRARQANQSQRVTLLR